MLGIVVDAEQGSTQSSDRLVKVLLALIRHRIDVFFDESAEPRAVSLLAVYDFPVEVIAVDFIDRNVGDGDECFPELVGKCLIDFYRVLEHVIQTIELVIGEVFVLGGVLSLEDFEVVFVLISVLVDIGVALLHGFLDFGDERYNHGELLEPEGGVHEF